MNPSTPEIARIALIPANRCCASLIARTPVLIVTKGTASAIVRTAKVTSVRRWIGTRSTLRATNGADTTRNTAPRIPKAANPQNAFQNMRGISSNLPVVNRSAANFVIVRPNPKSNSPMYPIKAHASASTPKRSGPRCLMRNGIENMPAANGKAELAILHPALPKIRFIAVKGCRAETPVITVPHSPHETRLSPIDIPFQSSSKRTQSAHPDYLAAGRHSARHSESRLPA